MIKNILISSTRRNELFQFAPIEEMKLALDRHINPNADDSDSSEGTGKDFSSNTKVEAVEDNVSEKIGAAFDKLLT